MKQWSEPWEFWGESILKRGGRTWGQSTPECAQHPEWEQEASEGICWAQEAFGADSTSHRPITRHQEGSQQLLSGRISGRKGRYWAHRIHCLDSSGTLMLSSRDKIFSKLLCLRNAYFVGHLRDFGSTVWELLLFTCFSFLAYVQKSRLIEHHPGNSSSN